MGSEMCIRDRYILYTHELGSLTLRRKKIILAPYLLFVSDFISSASCAKFTFSNVNFVQFKIENLQKDNESFVIVGVPKCLKLIYLRAQITTPHCEHCGNSNG